MNCLNCLGLNLKDIGIRNFGNSYNYVPVFSFILAIASHKNASSKFQ